MAFVSPFTAPTLTNYNASPPPDDGSQTAANQLNWSKHKEKLADPIKTYAEGLSAAAAAAFNKTINTDAGVSNDIASSVGVTPSELTISGFTVAGASCHHTITATGSSGTLALLTATALATNALLWLRSATGKTIYVSATATAAGCFTHPCLLDENNPTPFMYVNSAWRIAQHGWIRLDTATANSATALSTTHGIGTAFDAYMFVLDGVQPASDGVTCQLKFSVSGAFLDGTGYSSHAGGNSATDAAYTANLVDGGAQITANSVAVGNQEAEAISGVLHLVNAGSVTRRLTGGLSSGNAGGKLVHTTLGGTNSATGTVDGFRVQFSSGNVASGRLTAYGLKAA